MNGPGTHGPGTLWILGDNGLEHDKGKAGHAVGIQLLLTQRELARPLANRVWQRVPEVARSEIDAVRLPDVRWEVPRQFALEAREVTLELRAHLVPPARPHRAPEGGAEVPRDRRRPRAVWPLRQRRPRASGGCSPPSGR